MEQPDSVPQSALIDLTRQADVAFWCRVFDLSMDQLRTAVHHAGHEVAEVRRWLARQPPSH